jgi:hypothetical protein
VVPYSTVHGVSEPARLFWLPNDGSAHPLLPAGTPFGLVGTSSLYKRESFPGYVVPWAGTFDGLDAFNTSENEQSSNWGTQGSGAGKYANPDIWAVRVVAMETNTHRSYGPNEGAQFASHASERLRVLGEIPSRRQRRAVRLRAGHRQRHLAPDQRQPLRAPVPEPPQPPDLEALRPALRRLEQRRPSD